ncbi:hypothetical protein ACEPAF_7813 [Sanghuangporus sanghuang]
MFSLQRLSAANLPFTIAFASALFIFLRALSGAGYTNSQSEALHLSALNYSHLVDTAAPKPQGFSDFAEHWGHFKEAFLSCPSAANADGMDVVIVEDDIEPNDEEIVDEIATSPRQDAIRLNTACIKERLKDAISLFKPNGSAFAQEDRTFRFSFDGIPSSYFRNKDSSDDSSNADLKQSS